MKRGFLNTPKAQKQLLQGTNTTSAATQPAQGSYKYGVLPEAELALPKDYKPLARPTEGPDVVTLKYGSNEYIYATLPPVPPGTKYSDFLGGGYSECWISDHIKRTIEATPNFPTLPLTPTGGKAYRIAKAGDKGLGMFATRLIRAGDLIIDERPLIVVPASSIALEGVLSYLANKYTPDQRLRIMLHEKDRCMELAYNKLDPERKKAFMALFNCHSRDGSGEFMGRVRTNGIGIDGEKLRDKDTTGDVGRYSAVCDEISRINHSCCPNTVYHWHTDTFSVRVFAVRDIPTGAEITLKYCNIMAPAAERAAALDRYGINPCACSVSCSDPARAKIADERRARLKTRSMLVPPSTPEDPEDAWVQPAVKQLRELEEEGLQASDEYYHALGGLLVPYLFLQNVDKVLFYAKKLEALSKARDNLKNFEPLYLSREGMKTTESWKVVGRMPKSTRKTASGWLLFLQSYIAQRRTSM
ncbi:hypothetical protein BDP27DRAFT_1412669 [Rhodocollybia butyracea]|uniref:SET domain-containing protein n=1 Tax=Rhodocollybia butyracea TaxID=206335 RepID=A0A9P5UH65_9AGAR|nr:hypothetical protein BDP27DRAFT_1412669 [Rhodocollybia butyracea]